VLVDINTIAALSYFRADADGTLHIGALARHGELERWADLASFQPLMAAAVPLIADPVVRSRGTLVGSLCHADPQGDWAAVVMALDGYVVAQGPTGRRNINIQDLVTGPFQTTLRPDELAVEAVIPAPKHRAEAGFLKLERRVGDFATAGAAVALELDGATVRRAGIALTGVGSRTVNAEDAAAALVGRTLTDATIADAATKAAAAAQPTSDHRGTADYKRHVIDTFVTRILTKIAGTSTTKAQAAA
jgi:carbon-monoxide dehydrogenase medium subunit